MSETLLSAPAPQHAGAEAESPKRPDRRLVLFGVLGVVVLAAVALYFLVLHKSGTPAPSASPVTNSVPATHPTPKAATSPAPQTIPATYNDAVGRDPFVPLYTPPAASPAAAAPTAPAAVTANGAPGSSTSTTSGTTSSTTAAAAVTPAWIEMTGQTGTRYASFLVGYSDGTTQSYPNVMAPAQGSQTIFGQDFALDALGVGEAELQEGDSAPFLLKAGASNKHNFG